MLSIHYVKMSSSTPSQRPPAGSNSKTALPAMVGPYIRSIPGTTAASSHLQPQFGFGGTNKAYKPAKVVKMPSQNASGQNQQKKDDFANFNDASMAAFDFSEFTTFSNKEGNATDHAAEANGSFGTNGWNAFDFSFKDSSTSDDISPISQTSKTISSDQNPSTPMDGEVAVKEPAESLDDIGIANPKEALNELRSHIASLTEKNNLLMEKNKKLGEKNEKLTEKNQKLAERNERLTEAAQEMTSKNSKLTEEQSSLLEKQEDLLEEIAQHQLTVKQLTAQKNSAEVKASKAVEIADMTNDTIANFENELKLKEESIVALRQERKVLVSEHNLKIRRLQDEHNAFKVTLEQAEDLVKDLQNQFAMNEASETGLKKQLESSETRNRSLSTALKEKEEEMNALVEVFHELKNTNAVYKEQLDGTFDIDAFNEQYNKETEVKLLRLKKSLEVEFNTKLEALEVEIDRHAFEIERRDNAIQTLQDELSKKSEEILGYQANMEMERSLHNQDLINANEKAEAVIVDYSKVLQDINAKSAELKEMEAQLGMSENQLREKDSEIVTLRRQMHDFEEQSLKSRREVSQLKFDLGMKNSQIEEFDETMNNRMQMVEMKAAAEAAESERAFKQQQKMLQDQLEIQIGVTHAVENQLTQLEKEKEEVEKKYFDTLDAMEKRDNEIKQIRQRFLEMEKSYLQTDKTHEIDALKKANTELTNFILMNNENASGPSIVGSAASKGGNFVEPFKRITNSSASVSNFLDGPRMSYVPVLDDAIDVRLSEILAWYRFRSTAFISRLEPALYMIRGTKLNARLNRGDVEVLVNNSWIGIEDYLAEHSIEEVVSKRISSKTPFGGMQHQASRWS